MGSTLGYLDPIYLTEAVDGEAPVRGRTIAYCAVYMLSWAQPSRLCVHAVASYVRLANCYLLRDAC